jgi:lysophospholipase L1-like esterase
VLLGDSIRLGYQPLVTKLLAGRALVTGPARNGGDSARTLGQLDPWAIRAQPAVVHFNCGLHDVKHRHGRHQVELAGYEANLREMVRRLQETGARLVFATSTPVVDERHARRPVQFARVEADVRRYNEAAVGVMAEAGVAIDDLHGAVVAAGPERLLAGDGVHFTAAGYELLGATVAAAVERELA